MAHMTLQQAIELATAHERAGRLAEAESVYREILAQRPDEPVALHLLGCLAFRVGNLPAAEQLIRRSVKVGPEVAERHNDLGVMLQAMGRLHEAEGAFAAALKLKPNLPDALSNLAGLLGDSDNLDDAVKYARRAIELDPKYADAWNNLGKTLVHLGEAEQGVAAYRRAVELAPASVSCRSNLLLSLHYLPDIDPAAMLEAHREFGRLVAAAAPAPPPPRLPNKRDPGRRLRIGYVSGDFRQHSVGYFIEAALEKHDRAAFQVYCYSDVDTPDAMTRRMQSKSDVWHAIAAAPDGAVEQAIRQDQIDILVDLAGHAGRHRLAVFARRAAPVQVTYLGYPDTTGVPAMDCRLSDSHADPPGASDAGSVEKIVRLDPCAWCFRPHEPNPPVAPARSEGPIVFGTFNAIAKLNDPLLATWAEILRQLPEARLFMKAGGLTAASARERVRRQFAAHGVAEDRLELVGQHVDATQHLATYERLDIALDPFPYNGTTTTCEAMWMGVPVVTLAGRTHAGRVGVSLLSNVKLTELIAPDREACIRTAVDLARDRSRLAMLRQGLRQRMLASPLMNGFDFTRRLEAAYRAMWRQWCEAGRAGDRA